MKQRYALFRRRGIFYVEDHEGTPRQRSLGTRDKGEAMRLLTAYNEASHQKMLNLQLARVYLTASEPEMATRCWSDVFDEIIRSKKGNTTKRWGTARKDPHLAKLLKLKLIETNAKHFLDVLAAGTVSTNVYLRRLHNYALDMHWILNPVIPKRQWPAVVFGEKRAITLEEHTKIVEREANPERRDFYEMLWQLGGSQGDIASLCAEDVDWTARTISFFRAKLRNRQNQTPPIIHFGPSTEKLLMRLPKSGLLFPYLATVRSGDRATEFHQRCEGLGITGVTLHSYRYSWAERAAECGYPERFAMQALGQNSRAVHRVYAKKAKIRIPSLESYQIEGAQKIIPFKTEGTSVPVEGGGMPIVQEAN